MICESSDDNLQVCVRRRIQHNCSLVAASDPYVLIAIHCHHSSWCSQWIRDAPVLSFSNYAMILNDYESMVQLAPL